MKRFVVVAVLLLVAAVGALALRYASQRAEHQRLRELEVGRAPSPAPRRATPVIPTAPPVTNCLTGVALDHGTPVAGLQVSVSDSPYAISGDCPCSRPANHCSCRDGLALLARLPRAGLAEAVKSAITDASGRFELCALEGSGARLLWGEHLDGRLALPDALTSRPGSFVELKVVPFLPARGVVLANQAPVPGATVLAIGSPPVFARSFTTDARGRFETTLPAGLSDFVVSANGFAAQRVEHFFEPQRVVVLELKSSIELTVRALFEGRPLAGVEVTVDPEPPQLTDARGLARFSLQASGRPAVRAAKGDLLGSASVNLLEGQQSRSIDLTLEKGVRLSGQVVDEQGQPHEAKVRGFGRGKPVVTDAQGKFTSELIPATGEVRPVASAEGCDDSVAEAVVVHDAQRLTLKLSCGETGNGVVLDAEGKPLEDVLVRLDGVEHQENVHTDATGTFRFHQPPSMYQLKVSHERYRAYEQPLQLPAKDITVVLDAGGSIAGRVVNGKGAPLPGVAVTVVPAVLDALLSEVEGGNTSATTDPDGNFVVSGLLAGRLVVSATGDSLGTAVSDVVVLQPAEHRTGLVLTLDERIDLTGVVMDEQRRPITGARVRWDPADEKSALMGVLLDAVRGRVDEVMRFMPSPSFTDLDGRYVLRGLPVSKVKLDVMVQGFANQEKLASRGDQVDFVLLKEGGRVRGRVVDESGRPLPLFTVDSATFTADDGRFEVEAFGAEDNLFFTAPGFSRLSLTVKVDAPVKELGDVVMKKGRQLRVEARSEGQPLAGVRVAAAQTGDGDTCTTRADGACELEPLLAEQTMVKAVKDGFVPAEATVAPANFDQLLTLSLAPARGRITGQAFAAPGQPAAARNIFVAGAVSKGVLTEANGNFTAQGIPEGPYCVSIDSRGLRSLEWALHVQATPTPTPVQLGPLARGATVTGARTLPGRLVLVQGTAPAQNLSWVLNRGASSFCEDLKAPVVSTMTTGDFRIEGLAPGRWSAFFVSLTQMDEKGEVPPVVLDLLPGDVKQF